MPAVGERPPCVVVVLGDWGRSPRMQYHALSLAATRPVHVVAYAGKAPLAAVGRHPRVRLHALRPPPAWLHGLRPRPLALALKALLQAATLLYALLVRVPGRPAVVLLQTPPCIPTFAVCLLAASLRRCRLVIDWHNLGYTLLALSLGPGGGGGWLVRLARSHEASLGRRAHASLCVTTALRDALVAPPWRLRPAPVVLHDRRVTRRARRFARHPP